MKKRYWCDIINHPKFLYISTIVVAVLIVICSLIASNLVDAAFRKTTLKNAETAETYYDSTYSLKYEQLTNVVNSVFSPDGSMNLRVLDTINYKLVKDGDESIFICEFPNENKREKPYIITTKLSPNIEVLSQETNQPSRVEYVQGYLNEQAGLIVLLKWLFASCLFALFLCAFAYSIKASRKQKIYDMAAETKKG